VVSPTGGRMTVWVLSILVAALLAAAGAVLFVLSDSALAWSRFRQPFAAAQLAVLGTYLPAQWLIALSVGA